MTDDQIIAALCKTAPTPFEQAIIGSIKEKKRLAAEKAHVDNQLVELKKLWHWASVVTAPDFLEGGTDCNIEYDIYLRQIEIASEHLSHQEAEDLATASGRQLVANGIRRMLELIAPEDLNPQEIKGYADSMEE